jgi:hypothetical protein
MLAAREIAGALVSVGAAIGLQRIEICDVLGHMLVLATYKSVINLE